MPAYDMSPKEINSHKFSVIFDYDLFEKLKTDKDWKPLEVADAVAKKYPKYLTQSVTLVPISAGEDFVNFAQEPYRLLNSLEAPHNF